MFWNGAHRAQGWQSTFPSFAFCGKKSFILFSYFANDTCCSRSYGKSWRTKFILVKSLAFQFLISVCTFVFFFLVLHFLWWCVRNDCVPPSYRGFLLYFLIFFIVLLAFYPDQETNVANRRGKKLLPCLFPLRMTERYLFDMMRILG